MILSSLFFFYFFLLSLFSMVSHPVYYCVLLVVNSMLCSFICYSLYGFSWYSLLFCLVYIGGVYILFVFVSVHNPNSSVVSYWNLNNFALVLSIFFCACCGLFIYYLSLFAEFSSFLCSVNEGYFYICMCLTLLFGFFVLSLVMSVKVNHYR
uniref:NADH dehydrogenase subunit 6 n=1 Tax=Anindobothrium anacolum TaxID=2034264 RepID=A0A5B9IJ94_9CEST|nr:NADH dehydrogenase subunit 6 [Anindobothrium anacolum]QEF29880.1 NADH dehydrogenase subunit 6 [Anindobothrium anacolum]